MPTRRAVLLSLGIAAVAGVVIAAVWPGPGDEEQVREAIRAVADGARRADLAATLAPVSDRYADEHGATRDEVRLYLFREYQRRGPLTVLLSDIDVTVAGDLASAEFRATLADGVDVTRLDFLPGDADTLQFVVELEREDGDWMITGSRYARADTWSAAPR